MDSSVRSSPTRTSRTHPKRQSAPNCQRGVPTQWVRAPGWCPHRFPSGAPGVHRTRRPSHPFGTGGAGVRSIGTRSKERHGMPLSGLADQHPQVQVHSRRSSNGPVVEEWRAPECQKTKRSQEEVSETRVQCPVKRSSFRRSTYFIPCLKGPSGHAFSTLNFGGIRMLCGGSLQWQKFPA